MKIQTRVILLIGITVVVTLGLVCGVSRFFLLNDYRELENQVLESDVQRVLNALDDEITQLDIILFDWAAWDDTYAFMLDQNSQYLQANYVDETFESFPLNLVLILDLEGQVIYSKAYDLEQDTEVPVPAGFHSYLDSHRSIWYHSSEESLMKGMILLPEGSLLVASRPIITSDESGPIRGTLIMGRFFTEDRVERLAEITRIELEFRRWEDPGLPEDYRNAMAKLSGGSLITTQTLDQNTLAGYSFISDLEGIPVLILKVLSSRDIYQQGVATINVFLSLIGIIGLLAGLMLWLMLNRILISRLQGISEATRQIGEKRDFQARLPLSGKDEITSLAAEINSMIEELGLANQAKSQFIAAMSHELRTPLNAVMGFGELLADEVMGKLNDDQKSAVDDIIRSGRHLVSLLNDILDISKIEAGKFDIKLEIVDLGECINETVQSIMPVFNKKQQHLVSRVPDQKFSVRGDRRLLQQILFNLLSNANKFTPEEGTIVVSAERHDGEFWVSVVDDGVGIAEEDIPRVFEEFVQLSDANDGSGLGLKLVKRLVEVMDGKIWVESEPGKGSKFYFSLPAIENHQDD